MKEEFPKHKKIVLSHVYRFVANGIIPTTFLKLGHICLWIPRHYSSLTQYESPNCFTNKHNVVVTFNCIHKNNCIDVRTS